VHVWRACLDFEDATISEFHRTLSSDEQSRAERFVFQKDQKRFVAARGILRHILGQYLHVPPSQLSFFFGANGKPALSGVPGFDQFHFNLSHSDGLALYAVAFNAEVGIDVERIDPALDRVRIAESFFTPR
jgi:4'-phosphopantetheinyl transferase